MRVLLVLGLGLLVAGCGQSEASEVGRYTMIATDNGSWSWRLDTKTGVLARCKSQLYKWVWCWDTDDHAAVVAKAAEKERAEEKND